MENEVLVQFLMLAIAFVICWLAKITVSSILKGTEITEDCVSHKWFYNHLGRMECSKCKKKAGDV